MDASANIDTIQIEEMGAGTDEISIWVSLGFKSEISPFDVLFVVCGKKMSEQQIQHGCDSLYYERFDQGMSCHSGADSIKLEPAAITIHFTALGIKRMKFSETVRFDASAVPEQFAKVCKNLRVMKNYPWGSIVVDLEGR